MADDLSSFPVMSDPSTDIGDTFADYDPSGAAAIDNYSDAFSWGSIWDAVTSPTAKNLLNIGSGLYGLYESGQQRNLAKDAIKASDPFGPYRQQYAQQLMALMADPSTITKDPGYQFQLDQGSQAVERFMASKGFLGSGNEGIALQQYGQDYASKYLNEKVNQLAGLAGANITPNPAPGLNAYNQGLDTASASLASLGYGLTRAGSSAGTPGSQHPSAAGGEAAKVGGTLSTVGGIAKAGGATDVGGVLSTTGSAVGNFGNIISGIERGGTAGTGAAVSSGAKLASLAGYGGQGTSLVGAAGDAASGNYIGAAKNLYSAFAPATAGSLGLGSVASGAAANAALGEAGFGAAWATPSIEASVAGASGAGAAGTGAATTGAAAAGGSASLLGTAAAGAGYAGLVIAAGELLHHAFGGGVSNQRNRAAFEGLTAQWSPTQIARVGAKGMQSITAYNVPGIGWTTMTQGKYDELVGNLYGAVYHPDDNQAEWEAKLQQTLSSLQPLNSDTVSQLKSRWGGSWDDSAIQKILGG